MYKKQEFIRTAGQAIKTPLSSNISIVDGEIVETKPAINIESPETESNRQATTNQQNSELKSEIKQIQS